MLSKGDSSLAAFGGNVPRKILDDDHGTKSFIRAFSLRTAAEVATSPANKSWFLTELKKVFQWPEFSLPLIENQLKTDGLFPIGK